MAPRYVDRKRWCGIAFSADSASQPPDLELLELCDVSAERFRGIFRFKYAGDAFLRMRTMAQVRERERE